MILAGVVIAQTGGGRAATSEFASPTNRNWEDHMERSTTTPDEFLASLPDGTRQDMEALDAALAPVFAGHERVLWAGVFWGGTQQHIIGYGAYTYRGRSRRGGRRVVRRGGSRLRRAPTPST